MTVMLPIDTETEGLARRLAAITGKTLPILFKEAIEAKAAEAGIDSQPSVGLAQDGLLTRMMEITDGFALLPVLDPRSADEIIGYDEQGLAR